MAVTEGEGAGLTIRLKSVFWTASRQPPVAIPRPRPAVRSPAPAGVGDLPATDRVRAAFRAVPPNEVERQVIGVLMARPGATSAELSRACGWPAPIWHTHFALLCQRRAAWLWPEADAEAGRFLMGVVAEYDATRGRFTLRPEMAAAFRAEGIRAV